MKIFSFKNPNRAPLLWLMVTLDALMCAASFLIVTFLHSQSARQPFGNYFEMLCYCLPTVVAVRLLVFAYFKL